MTGRELIEWIEKNKAEDKEVIIQHRDSGGFYGTAEHAGEFLKPKLIKFSNELYGVIAEITLLVTILRGVMVPWFFDRRAVA